jgi:cell division protein ZapA (FtsZ GTPase activity inhibitor)
MDNKIEIRIVCDNDDPDTINDAIDALKDRIERMGSTCGTVEGDNYVIEIN